MFFVAGITGKVGGAAARRLLEKGCSVRTIVREPKKAQEWSDKGVEVRQGDFSDVPALAAALEGVEGAFLMLPPFFTPSPDFSEARDLIACYKEALSRSLPPRVVGLSSIGSQQPSGLGMITATHLLEEGLRDIDLPIAFVRPGSFLENYIPNLTAAAKSGRFDSFLLPVDRAIPMVGTADTGAEIARLLTGPEWTGKRVVELGSARSPNDLAEAMSTVLGRDVTAYGIPREKWTEVLQSQGMPAGFIAPFAEMEEGFNSGWISFGVPDTESTSATLAPADVFQQAYTKQS